MAFEPSKLQMFLLADCEQIPFNDWGKVTYHEQEQNALAEWRLFGTNAFVTQVKTIGNGTTHLPSFQSFILFQLPE